MSIENLPQELIEHIISFVCLTQIPQCSTVACNWVYPSQRHLFRHLFIRISPASGILSALSRLFTASPHLALHVRSVMVIDETEMGRTPAPDLLFTAACVLKHLKALREIELAFRGASWGPTPMFEDMVLKPIQRLPELSNIVVSGVSDLEGLHDISALVAQSSCSRLGLTFVKLREHQRRQDVQPCSEEQTMSNITHLALLLPHASPGTYSTYFDGRAFPNLATIQFNLVDFCQLVTIRTILASDDFPTLETFICHISCPMYPPSTTGHPHPLFSLSKFRNIIFTMSESYAAEWGLVKRFIGWWADVFAIHSADNRTATIQLTIPLAGLPLLSSTKAGDDIPDYRRDGRLKEEAEDWRRLDGVLTSPAFVRLQEVKLRLIDCEKESPRCGEVEERVRIVLPKVRDRGLLRL
ncbi:hypothetical protein CYLTODRAFT_422557 [Cylindrobasidium torrendii FP15055 ss-10]|uniref:Uncharacterized protein n=1 Tax=Cylindrobasidium torrendii FP15055 ss-10 TaxID=1314674 RepID=A0A0D7BA05_9AGAR|nr:hypothetical protein CYLTODRAFT_422557 [Cylindrobasidium torrendii FP15055 ss-10]